MGRISLSTVKNAVRFLRTIRTDIRSFFDDGYVSKSRIMGVCYDILRGGVVK